MCYIESTLLPYIMELISREHNLCKSGTTMDDLTVAVKDAILEKHISPFGSIEMAVRFAVEVGTNMGILSVDDNVLPAPFNFKVKKPDLNNLYTTAQGRKAVKRMLENSRAKPKSKAAACARKRPGQKKPVSKKQAACKTKRKGAKPNPKRNLKAKSKKRCS